MQMGVNLYKVRYVLEFIRRQGRLPTDAYGQLLSAHDMIAWFGLKDCLTKEELSYIEEELVGLIEAERAVERLRQSYEARSGVS
jgi:hypothetical protein